MLKESIIGNLVRLDPQQLRSLYLEFCGQLGDGKYSNIGFAAYLYKNNKISSEEYKNICAEESVDVTSLDSDKDGSQGEGLRSQTGDRGTQFRVGEYDVLQTIDSGAMGEIMLAYDTRLARTVVYKSLKEEILDKKNYRRRFFTEAQVIAQLEHPSIIPIHSLLMEKGRLGYTMKLIRGKTLRDYIVETQRQYDEYGEVDEQHSLSSRLEHFLKICDAVHYAHRKGVLHRDLKPRNIMLGDYNEVYVMDWGIAKLVRGHGKIIDTQKVVRVVVDEGKEPNTEKSEAQEEEEAITHVGRIVGTPAYMSPEQASAKHDLLDGRSDLYSLGLILHEIVTLYRGIRGKNPREVLMKARNGTIDPVPVYSKQADIQEPLFAIVNKATQTEIAERYATVEEFSDDLRRFMHGESIHARPENVRQKVLRWISNHRRATLKIMVWSTLVCFVLISLFLYQSLVHYRSGFHALLSRDSVYSLEHQALNRISVLSSRANLIDSSLRHAQQALDDLVNRLSMLPAVSDTGLFSSAQEGIDLQWSPYTMSQMSQAPPADYAKLPGYLQPVSLQTPVWLLHSDQESANDMVRLSAITDRLSPYFAELDVHHDPDIEALLPMQMSGLGLGLQRLHLVLNEGDMLAFPANTNYPVQFDAREVEWFKAGEEFSWHMPYLDASGEHELLSVSRLLPDASGVVQAEISVAYLEQQMLSGPVLSGTRVWMMDRNGAVIAFSSVASQGDSIDAEERVLSVARRVLRRRASDQVGYFFADRNKQELMIYCKLMVPGWYMVMWAPPRVP